MFTSIKDSSVVVTGGSKGIGKGIATVFAKQGAKVMIASRGEEEGNETAKSIRSKGGIAEFCQCDVSDWESVKNLVNKTASEVQKRHSAKIKYYVGTMIELPRAAIRAKDIAKYADFFSFGTNDLTQTTFGISRDDSGKFLNDYIDNKIFDVDPFVSIDQNGVGELVEIASSRGRKTNKNIKLGICGEHGGDPASIEFCEKAKLNYVSCSPYRVPIARLAAAQAYLKKKR